MVRVARLELTASCRLLRLRLAYLWLGDPMHSVPALPLFAENSTLYCFLNAKTLTAQEACINPAPRNKKKQSRQKSKLLFTGTDNHNTSCSPAIHILAFVSNIRLQGFLKLLKKTARKRTAVIEHIRFLLK